MRSSYALCLQLQKKRRKKKKKKDKPYRTKLRRAISSAENLPFSVNLALSEKEKERRGGGGKVFESPVSGKGNKHRAYPEPPLHQKRKGEKVQRDTTMETKKTRSRATELANCPGWRW